MLAKNYPLLVLSWLALSACNSGMDTIAEDPTSGPNATGGAGKSTTSGSGGSASSGTSGSEVPGAGGSDTSGASGSGAGVDVTTGGAGAGRRRCRGTANPVEAGVDLKPDAAAPRTASVYWKLDEASGTTAADSSGHNHTATVSGATFVAGKVGAHAASFNGTSAYAEATGPVVDMTKPYTVAAWVQLTAVADFKTAVSIDGAAVSASSSSCAPIPGGALPSRLCLPTRPAPLPSPSAKRPDQSTLGTTSPASSTARTSSSMSTARSKTASHSRLAGRAPAPLPSGAASTAEAAPISGRGSSTRCVCSMAR